MDPSSENGFDIPRRRWLTVLGTVEGYLSLFVTFVALVLPVSPGNERLVTVIGVTLIGVGLGLAIGGIRFGTASGRGVAWVSLVVLSIIVIALLARKPSDILWR